MKKILKRITNKVAAGFLAVVMMISVAAIPATQVFADDYNGALPRILVNCSYALFTFHNDEWLTVIDNNSTHIEDVENAMSYFQGDFLEYAKLVDYAAYINVPAYKLDQEGTGSSWTFASANTQIGLDSFLLSFMNGELNEKQLKELRKTYPYLVIMEYTDECKLSVKKLWCAGGQEETYIADMEMYANNNNGPLYGVVPDDVQLGAPRDMYIIFGVPYNVGMYPTLDFDMTTGKNVKKYIPDYTGANKRKTPTLNGTPVGGALDANKTPTNVSAEITDSESAKDGAVDESSSQLENNVTDVAPNENEAVAVETTDYSNSNMLLRLLIVVLILFLIAAIVVIIILLTKNNKTMPLTEVKEEKADKQDE